jgi:exodeoxyribonuclease VII large subunit
VITSEAQLRLKSESKLFKNVVKQTVMQNKQIVNSSLKELASSVKFSVLHQQNSIRKNEQGVYRNARFLVSSQTSELGKLNVSLPVVVKAKFLSETNKVINVAQSIRLMDPINVLNRGFSITLLNGKTIGKNNKVKNGDLILTKTATFNVKSKVEITENNE